MTPAEKRGSAFTEEENWRENSFVGDSGEIPWAPVRVGTAATSEDWAIGRHYAMELIEHLRDFADPEDPDAGGRLLDVARAIVKSGRFEAVERGFFHALGCYIATGRIGVSCFFSATMPDDISMSFEDRAEAREARLGGETS